MDKRLWKQQSPWQRGELRTLPPESGCHVQCPGKEQEPVKWILFFLDNELSFGVVLKIISVLCV